MLPVNVAAPVAGVTLDDVPVTVNVTVPLLVKLVDPTAAIAAMPVGKGDGGATVTVPLKPLVKLTFTESEPGKALNNVAVLVGMLMVNGSCALKGSVVEAEFFSTSAAKNVKVPDPAPEPVISNTTVAEPPDPEDPTAPLELASTTTEPTPSPLHALMPACPPRRPTSGRLP
jgi:hypothetical protein